MSRIDDLIAEHCPDGVELKTVGDVTSKGSNIRWADAGEQEFRYIDLSSVDRATRKIGETAMIRAGDAPSRAQQIVRQGDVIFATTRPTQMRWAVIPAEYDGQIASTGYCVLRPNNELISTSFLAHLLGAEPFRRYLAENQVEGNYPSISDKAVRAFRIPVPPPAVQREIAAILDKMEMLKAELESELELRSRQYAFYRDSLLTFAEAPPQSVRWVPMGEIGEFFRGRRFVKDDVVPEGLPSIHYGEIYTGYGVFAQEALSHVREDLAPGLRFARTGDVVFAAVGETVEDVAKAVAWLGDDDVAIHDDCFAFRSDLNPKFVAYYAQTARFHSEKNRHVARAKVKRISGDSLAKIMIPVPAREGQQRIVAILDKFDALVNDLSVGLPAEINARRQQYEYYRDKLLSFPEIRAAA
ncbi:MAG: restriction endonuclease subunit S [Aeromicrobium sp.]|uniref:restriction endonuclease subunit S n=1 Tax=Aeromicrobium sp. TaxID=1871063 RepID=UPI0039E5CFA2